MEELFVGRSRAAHAKDAEGAKEVQGLVLHGGHGEELFVGRSKAAHAKDAKGTGKSFL
jgi:hypothetical protein